MFTEGNSFDWIFDIFLDLKSILWKVVESISAKSSNKCSEQRQFIC